MLTVAIHVDKGGKFEKWEKYLASVYQHGDRPGKKVVQEGQAQEFPQFNYSPIQVNFIFKCLFHLFLLRNSVLTSFNLDFVISFAWNTASLFSKLVLSVSYLSSTFLFSNSRDSPKKSDLPLILEMLHATWKPQGGQRPQFFQMVTGLSQLCLMCPWNIYSWWKLGHYN